MNTFYELTKCIFSGPGERDEHVGYYKTKAEAREDALRMKLNPDDSYSCSIREHKFRTLRVNPPRNLGSWV